MTEQDKPTPTVDQMNASTAFNLEINHEFFISNPELCAEELAYWLADREQASFNAGVKECHAIVKDEDNEYYLGKTGTVVHQLEKKIQALIKQGDET